MKPIQGTQGVQAGATIIEHFAQLADPRKGTLRYHKLIDILVIAICAVICGADDYEAIRC